MAPKKKAQKMALADFFADAASGSWADEMDTLPTAPAARPEGALPKKGEPGYLDSMPDRGARMAYSGVPPREELPLPDVPPYTAFIGNLVFEVDEDALREFFSDEKPTSVRLVKDPTGKPKGFGYVEFGSRDGLKAALDKNMSQMMGRTLRVSVAEAPAKREGFPGAAADSADQWRRTTPLPARTEAPATARRTSSFADRPDREASGPDLDWGAARGSRFAPSAPHSPSGLGRDSSGPGREREFREPRDFAREGPSMADEAGQWRSARPMVEARGSREGSMRGGMTGDSSPSMAETETTASHLAMLHYSALLTWIQWSRGTKLRTPVVDDAPHTGTTASPADERDREWRSSRATSAVPSADGGSPRQAPPAPLERRKLALAPRSVPQTPSTATSPADSKPDTRGIFGSAKPIDSATKEREAEEKLAHRDEERRKAKEEEAKKHKEEEERGKQLQEEKLRKFKEEQSKATAEAMKAAGLPAPAPEPQERGQNGPRRGGPPRGGAPAWGGHRRTSSGNANANPNSNPNSGPGENAWNGPRRPSGPGAGVNGERRRSSQDPNRSTSGNRGPKSPPVISEDGFEGVSRGSKPKEERPKTILRKESGTRPGFSFAAAANKNAFDLLDEGEGQGGEDEADEAKPGSAGQATAKGDEGGEEDKAKVNGDGVEGVTNRVDKVTV